MLPEIMVVEEDQRKTRIKRRRARGTLYNNLVRIESKKLSSLGSNLLGILDFFLDKTATAIFEELNNDCWILHGLVVGFLVRGVAAELDSLDLPNKGRLYLDMEARSGMIGILICGHPSRAVLIFCKLNGIDFEEITVDLIKRQHLSPEFKEINPMRQVPTIVDGDFKLFESHAILRYLACAFPGVADHWYPTDHIKRAKIDSVLDWHHSNLRHGAVTFLQNTVFAPGCLCKIHKVFAVGSDDLELPINNIVVGLRVKMGRMRNTDVVAIIGLSFDQELYWVLHLIEL
ncbi:Glutathione S-transferase T1 [Camellia lanceoleosa]|uniref:Glutathione S-transferase T1 n=1 Tax=Camellia lanceoleosa TaxID=1840588 RepID=A0ACC0FG07_9ERIC|nr:Glutathione S-transferase T1 [Camellia lanceoleosa]